MAKNDFILNNKRRFAKVLEYKQSQYFGCVDEIIQTLFVEYI